MLYNKICHEEDIFVMHPLDCGRGFEAHWTKNIRIEEKGCIMANIGNLNNEQIEGFKSVLSSLDNLMTASEIFAAPLASQLSGMTLSQALKTELISLALVISNVDSVITQEECDLLNELFGLQGDCMSYKGIADSIGPDFLSRVPVWVMAMAYTPEQACPKNTKADYVSNAIVILGILVSAVDGADDAELAVAKKYAGLCANYVLTH